MKLSSSELDSRTPDDNLSLLSYNLNEYDKYPKSVQSFSTNSDFDLEQYLKQQSNVKKLNSFLNLHYNWNGYRAKPFDKNLMEKCVNLIKASNLQYQPEIFPTGRESIQFEYEKEDGSYLEIEIYSNRIALLFIDSFGHELEQEKVQWENVLSLINDFHA